MNIEPYRASFSVCVADSSEKRAAQCFSVLSNAGYHCHSAGNRHEFFAELKKKSPQVVIFQYQDEQFFNPGLSHEDVIASLRQVLPKVKIIFLSPAETLAQACQLYEFDVFDCIRWPIQPTIQLLRAVDRACENDYHQYLNEQLRDHEVLGGMSGSPDFGLFNVWLKELEKTENREQAIHHWLQEAVRVLQTDKALYFKYIESKKSLVAVDSIGFAPGELLQVGLDLSEKEPGFESNMLFEPSRMMALQDFVNFGLLRADAQYFSLVHENQVQGVFVVPAKPNSAYFADQEDNGYLQSCLKLITRHFEYYDLKAKFLKFSIYDVESEALHNAFVMQKMKEEISRARRITLPVSLLKIAIDSYDDLTLEHTKENILKLLKSFADVLVKNSRLNDIVGRLARGEFVLCLPHTDRRGGSIKAERLRRLIESADFSEILGPAARITISVGISEYPSLCGDVDALMHSSDDALSSIKRVGKNKICLAVAPAHFVPDFFVKEVKFAPNHNR